MSYKILTLNKISPEGLKNFNGNYAVSDGENTPDAILVRSAKVATDNYDGLLAVARAGAGVNNITIGEATKKGVCVFNTPGANANAVAELVMTMMGFAARNIGESLDYTATLVSEESDEVISKAVEANKSNFRGFELKGKKLAVIGLGKIGVLVSNYAIDHGMEVNAYDPWPTIGNVHYLNSKVNICGNFNDAINDAELITVHVPLSDKTRDLVGSDELELVKDGCILLNFARDGIINDDAIEEGIKSGKVAKFVTDFPKKRFLNNKNVISTPHLGASTSESEENCAVMAVNQLSEYLEFGTVTNSVNFPIIEAPVQKSTKSRIIVITEDIPNMIANITKVIGETGLNIVSFSNESNGKIGYNIIDLDTAVEESVVSSINSLGNIIKVRLIQF